MGFKVRYEEYTALGDFIMTSFVRDQPKIVDKFLETLSSEIENLKIGNLI